RTATGTSRVYQSIIGIPPRERSRVRPSDRWWLNLRGSLARLVLAARLRWRGRGAFLQFRPQGVLAGANPSRLRVRSRYDIGNSRGVLLNLGLQRGLQTGLVQQLAGLLGDLLEDADDRSVLERVLKERLSFVGSQRDQLIETR